MPAPDDAPPHQPSTTPLALLFGLVTATRALVLTVIPVRALALLGDPQGVSVLYFCVSVVGVCVSLSLPLLARRAGVRGVFVVGAVSMLVSAVLLAQPAFPALAAGMILHVLGFTSMEVALVLVLLASVPSEQYAHFEPKRILAMASAYIVGPSLGVFLAEHVAPGVPYAASALCATLALVALHVLGLHRAQGEHEESRGGGPLGNVRRFAAQPRLRVAWLLALGRASWWQMFFIYTPLFAVTSGLGAVAGGVIVSTGVAMVLGVPIWGRIGRRYGLRRMFSASFLATGVLMVLLAAFSEPAWLGAALLLAAAAAITPIDGGGNVPFLRAVRTGERADMTGVFNTYRDLSQLGPPGLAAVLLRIFDLPAVFLATGMAMFALSRVSRRLPRRL